MATIKEVAELAGVSIGTVSHVIGGSVPVSDHLRQKVRAAIEKLDYHPNHIARSLKTRKTRTLGIVVPDMTIPFFPQVIRSAELAAHAQGYSMIAVNSNDSSTRQKEVLSLLRSQQIEGILLVIASGRASQEQIPGLVDSGIPVVCLDRLPDAIEIDSVGTDDSAAAEMAVSHLLANGHGRIAILTGPLSLRNERDRLHGYRSALERDGIAVREELIWEAKLRQEDVVETCRRHLHSKNRPSALFCTNGVTGLGALRGMAESGFSTPADIAFATFDELTPDGIFRPAITSVVQPANEIGYRAAEILLGRIQSGSQGGSRIQVRLPATLKIRESSSLMREIKKGANGIYSRTKAGRA